MGFLDHYAIRNIYGALPYFLQNWAISLVGWGVRRRRLGRNFSSLLKSYIERDSWARDRLRAFRDERLREFVLSAVSEVPHYQALIRKMGMSPEEAASPEGFSSLPILSKQDVNSNPHQFNNPGVSKRGVLEQETSGTTGTALAFPVETDSHREQWAVWWRHRFRHGLSLDTWSGLFGGHPIVPQGHRNGRFWRINRPLKQVMFSNYHMSDTNLVLYLEEIRRRGLTWLHGYPSALALLAEAALRTGFELPELRWITTGAETLRDSQAEMMRLAFGIDAVEHYGLSEGVANISQCSEGNYHVDEDFSYVEFIPHAEIAGVHRIVGTNLTNRAFPLLRYDTMDLVVVEEGGCGCGLPGRVVSKIIGREDDYVATPSGHRVGRLDHIFKGVEGIREAQIIQDSPSSLLFRIATAAGFDKVNEDLILTRTRQFLGTEMEVTLEYVDEIYRTSAGKLKFVVSKVDEV